ncbi:hypothetical protein [Chryseobacterium bernardetii]|uniref:hypothetical protein n=1 Tax=Chryseobacterium bernardetii TaxID=1241978 RepID=UPI0016261FD8|nr:hypothetical protein [Chryseobacterium bernardetii]
MSVNIKSPTSYFFTETSFSQGTGNKSFGELNANEFQITTTFDGSLKAYAVTDGILFFARHGSSNDKVNILLKPSTPVDFGVKVKYFVYRGINANDLFKTVNGKIQLNDSSSLEYLSTVRQEYTSLYGSNSEFTADKIGYLSDISSGSSSEVIKKFFPKDAHNLVHIKAGTHIGNFFSGAGGFEIVVDEGDFSQKKSDTGLEFDLKFATATSCILKSNGSHSVPDIFGGKENPNIDARIFRENIFKFIDPAAFYGSHVTNNIPNGNTGSICIGGTSTSYSTMDEIYNNFVKKFNNKFKTYFYAKGNDNRSLNFYNSDNILKVNGVGYDLSTLNWPVIVLSLPSCNIEFTNIVSDDSFFSTTFLSCISSLSKPQKSYFFSKIVSNYVCNLPFVNSSGNKIFSSFTFLVYNKPTSPLDSFFGPVNLESVFEREDYTSNQGSIVSNLRPVLIKDGDNIGVYNSKLVLEGYLAEANPANIPTDPTILSKTLRTYILLPQDSTIPLSDVSKGGLNARYYTAVNDSDSYCKTIYEKGKIWKGKIYDGQNINALLYRKKDNDDDNAPIYQLGISQADYKKIVDEVYTIDSNATNLTFHFENEASDTKCSFYKYDLKVKFDKVNGQRGQTIECISVYTIDGYFFFSKDYSDNFRFFEEFANIAVDFLPTNLSSYNYGYECGFDFIGFEGREKYYEVMGKYYKKSTGQLENIDVSDGSLYEFRKNKQSYFKLLSKNYNHKPSNWRYMGANLPFHTDSFITLYPGKETTVRLNFTKSQNPSKLYIKYNKKYVAINNSTATPSSDDEYAEFEIPAANYTSINTNYTVKIKSLQASYVDIPIEVYAVEGSKKLLAGKCWLLKNSEAYILKTILVNVQTNITGTVNNGLPNADVPQSKSILNNFLNQAFLKVKDGETTKNFNLDLTNDPGFKVVGTTVGTYLAPYTDSGVTYYAVKDTQDVFAYCMTKLKNENPTVKVDDFLVLFFFDEPGGDGGGTAGIADKVSGYKGARIYRHGLKRNTIAHEALHSIALYHSFDNDGEYTFRITWLVLGSIIPSPSPVPTDNVMDYFQFKPVDEDKLRKLIWKWQMNKILKMNYNNSKLIKDV